MEQQLTAMLQAQQVMQQNMLEMLDRMNKAPASGMVDNRGIGKPPTLNGDASKYMEFMAKLTAFAKAAN